MQKPLIYLSAFLFMLPLSGMAQMRFTSRGNLLLGSFYGSTLNQTNNSDQNFIFINGQYQGLRMVNGNSITAQPYFQIDLTKGSPCIFGSNGSSTGEVDFCDGGIYWNTLMVRNTYIGMDGYLQNGLYQPLKEVSAIQASLTEPNVLQSKNDHLYVSDTDTTVVLNVQGILSLLTGASQQLQGKIIRQQADLNAMNSETDVLPMLQNQQRLQKLGSPISISSSAIKADDISFATLSTLDGKIIRKAFPDTSGNGNLKIDTSLLEAGTYLLTLFQDGKIRQTSYFVITE